jgi:hypothetical protein
MRASIVGPAFTHSGSWFKDDDVKKESPQPYHSVMVMEQDEKWGAVLRKVKVPVKLVSAIAAFHGQNVELVVDLKETNYDNKPATEFIFVSGKVAARG